MKKRFLLSAVSLILTATVLGACGSSGGETKNKSANPDGTKTVTLKYFNWDNDNTTATKDLIAGFEAKHPNIKVESVSLVPGNSLETLKKMDVTMSSGEQIDIVLLPNSDEVVARAAQGVLAPLDDFYKSENIVAEEEYYINPSYQGKTYATMLNETAWMVMLNEDALKEANLPVPTFGWTWDDYREYAKKLNKGEGADKRYGTYFHTWGEYVNMIAYTDKQNPYLTPDLKPQFDDPSFTYFFNLRRAMEQEDKSAKPFSDVIGAKLSYAQEFLSGKAAMVVTGSFNLANVINTEKYPHTFKTVFAPLPRPSKDADPSLTYIGGQYMAIAANSKYKEEAYKFIRYASTEQEARADLSGWKKGDGKALLERLYGSASELIDLPSLETTLYDENVKTAVAPEISVSYGSQLKKVTEDGFSKFILDNQSVEEVQAWMMDEAQKIIEQNTK